MPDDIAYYRVSTDKQGARGLGMDAQREAVSRSTASSLKWQAPHEPPAAPGGA